MNRRRLPADTGISDRLRACAAAIAEHGGGQSAEIERRNELISKAIEAGYTYRATAEMARVSVATVSRAVTDYEPEPDEPVADASE